MSSFIERLAGRVVSLEKKVNRALTSPQLGSSSIENGGSIEEYDGDGQLVSIIGTQPDGTHGAVVVSGPIPPRPAAPGASGGPGLLNYAWDGVFANAATGEPEETIPAPMDFARVEVHASKTSGFSAVTADTLVGTIESPRGSSNSVVAESGTWYVVLVTRALSGKASMQSLETSAVVQAAPDVEGLLDEFNQEAYRLQQELNANASELADAQGRLDTLTASTGSIDSAVQAIRDTELPALQGQINTKNKTVNSTGNASGTTGYSAGDTWQKWTSLDSGGKLVAAWRFTVDNTWEPVILDPTYLPQVDIGAGTFGELSGGRLKAGSVEAQALLVGVGPNLIPNGAGEWGKAGAWSEGLEWLTGDKPDGLPGSFNSSGGTYSPPSVFWDVEPNTEYRFEVWVRADKAGSVMYIEMRDQAGAHAATWTAIRDQPSAASGGYPVGNYTVPTGWTKLTAKGTTSAAANKMRVFAVYFNHTNGTVRDATQYIAGMRMFRMTDGSMVVEDTIRGEHVEAQSVGAKVGAFVEADIGKLTVTGATNLRTVVAERMAANIGSFVKLYASQVFIGQGGNQIVDPAFTDPAWNTARQTHSMGTWALVGGSSGEPSAMRTTTATTNTQFLYPQAIPSASNKAEMIPVTSGQVYEFSVDVTTNISASCRWNIWTWRADGTFAYTGLTSQPGSGRRALVQEYTVPSGVIGIHVAVACLTGQVVWTVHGNATVREKVTPSLIVDGFFQGLRVIGASIETNAAANTGIKLTDAGLVGHGVANDYDPVGQINIGYNTKASIDIRKPAWTSFPSDLVPGLWFDSVKQGAAGATPPAVPAAVTASNAPAQGVRIQSSQQISALDYRSSLVVDQNLVALTAQSDRTSTSAPPREQAVATVGSTGFSFSAIRSDGLRSVGVQGYTNDGVLSLSGTNITANGDSLTNITRSRVTLTNGYTQWTGGGWNGLWIENLGKMVIITGAVGNSTAWSAGSLIANIPSALRPPNKVQGVNCELQADGRLQMNGAGSTAQAMSLTYFLP